MRPTAVRCITCHASPGARCRTKSGRYASQPHVARLIPRFECPRCGTVDMDLINVAQGYCSVCHDWTGDEKPAFGQEGFEGL
jgi:hypothetical protein